MNQDLLDIIRSSLQSIKEPRFFDTERGYQGELLSEIKIRLKDISTDEHTIIEQEYQKQLYAHGLHIRPDLIIHVPFNYTESRTTGNVAVIELKLKANKISALQDYAKLAEMCQALKYSTGIFINIGSNKTFINYYKGRYKESLVAFAVDLYDGKVTVIEEWAT